MNVHNDLAFRHGGAKSGGRIEWGRCILLAAFHDSTVVNVLLDDGITLMAGGALDLLSGSSAALWAEKTPLVQKQCNAGKTPLFRPGRKVLFLSAKKWRLLVRKRATCRVFENCAPNSTKT